MLKFLVIGGDSLIGGAIADFLEQESAEVHRTSRRPARNSTSLSLDLSSPNCSIASQPWYNRIFGDEPPIVFLTAAVTGYARCETDPVSSRLVNVVNTGRIAAELLRRGAFVVYPSSNAVFSRAHVASSEASPPEPGSEYGKQKAEAEMQLRSAAARTGAGGLAIVRLTKVVSRRSSLIDGWIDDLRAGRPIEAARDVIFAPVSLQFVVQHLVALGKLKQSGIYHLSGERDVSYFDFAQLLGKTLGVEEGMVRPAELKTRLASIPTPEHSTLAMGETTRRTGINPQPAEKAVRDLLEEEPGPTASGGARRSG